MKNLLKNLAVALFLGIAFTSNAEEKNSTPMKSKTFEVGMYQSINTLKMNVNVEKSGNEVLSVILRDAKGMALFKSVIGKGDNTYHGTFDMSELEDGKYSFEFTKGNEKIVKEIELQSNAPKEIIRQISLD